MATSLAKKEKNGSKLLTSFIVSKKSPMCAIHIIADDGMNKDKKSYDVAKSLIKKIQFKNPSPLPPDYSSLFFTLKNIPDYAYITE